MTLDTQTEIQTLILCETRLYQIWQHYILKTRKLKKLKKIYIIFLTTYLSGLDQFVDEVNGVVAVISLAHHLSNTVRTDAIIWSNTKAQSLWYVMKVNFC